jgi:hypothetical protein
MKIIAVRDCTDVRTRCCGASENDMRNMWRAGRSGGRYWLVVARGVRNCIKVRSARNSFSTSCILPTLLSRSFVAILCLVTPQLRSPTRRRCEGCLSRCRGARPAPRKGTILSSEIEVSIQVLRDDASHVRTGIAVSTRCLEVLREPLHCLSGTLSRTRSHNSRGHGMRRVTTDEERLPLKWYGFSWMKQ